MQACFFHNFGVCTSKVTKGTDELVFYRMLKVKHFFGFFVLFFFLITKIVITRHAVFTAGGDFFDSEEILSFSRRYFNRR